MMKPFNKNVVVYLLLFTSTFFMHLQCKAQYEKCHIDDWIALKVLYENTNFYIFLVQTGWVDTTNWDSVTNSFEPPSDCDLSTLYGVGLNENGRVDSINLNFNGLTGILPNEITQLSDLRFLDLNSNGLGTKIPERIDNLTKLEHLDLSSNEFTGNIPIQLANLSELKVLWLNNNEFSGSIPKELASLTNLLNLNLSFNQLEGHIPTELASLTNLSKLNLSFNLLEGPIPIELELLKNIEYLELNFNQLGSNIPKELGQLSNLKELNLADNSLSGSIPSQLRNLNNLIKLNLSDNQFIGEIPSFIEDLQELRYLYLGSNEFSGDIPPQIGNLPNLEELSIFYNSLSGSIPPQIGNLCKLRNLYLHGNQLEGTLPKELGNLSKLRHLYLNNNELTGSIPAELANLNNLSSLRLGSNNLSGVIPKELGFLNNLRELRLSSNQLEGRLPAEFGYFTNMYYLYILDNNLSGCFDKRLYTLCNRIRGGDWGDYSSYIGRGNSFDVSFEEFCSANIGICETCRQTDSLALVSFYNLANGKEWLEPWDIENGSMSNWKGVDFDASNCVVSINLEDMNINAKFSDILEPLTKLNLELLDLSNNEIYGHIPSKIKDLNNIKVLKLKNNQLQGNLPPQLVELQFLDTLQISNNNLSGCYDSFIEYSFCCSSNIGNPCFTNEDISDGNQFDTEWENFCEKEGYNKCVIFNIDVQRVNVTESNSVEFYIITEVPVFNWYAGSSLQGIDFTINAHNKCNSYDVEMLHPYIYEDSISISNESNGILNIKVNEEGVIPYTNDSYLLKIKTCPFPKSTKTAKIDISGNIHDIKLNIPLDQGCEHEKLLYTLQVNQFDTCRYDANFEVISKSKKPFKYVCLSEEDTIFNQRSYFSTFTVNDLEVGYSYALSIEDAEGKSISNSFIIPGNKAYCTFPELVNVPHITMDSSFTIYPNPTDDFFFIDLPKGLLIDKYQLSIFDAAGKLVKTGSWSNTSVAIDVKELKAGIYFIELKNQRNSMMKKLYIQ